MSGCLPEQSGIHGRGLRAGGEVSEHPDTEAADLDAAWYGSGDDVAPEQVGEHGSGERDPGDRAASRGNVDERSFLLVGQRRQVVSTGRCRPKAVDLVHEGSSLIAGTAAFTHRWAATARLVGTPRIGRVSLMPTARTDGRPAPGPRAGARRAGAGRRAAPSRAWWCVRSWCARAAQPPPTRSGTLRGSRWPGPGRWRGRRGSAPCRG